MNEHFGPDARTGSNIMMPLVVYAVCILVCIILMVVRGLQGVMNIWFVLVLSGTAIFLAVCCVRMLLMRKVWLQSDLTVEGERIKGVASANPSSGKWETFDIALTDVVSTGITEVHINNKINFEALLLTTATRKYQVFGIENIKQAQQACEAEMKDE